ncbi:MAG: glycerophosphodiester phosphodiesterase [Burkholderiales bacterium]|nr:MAG: glycerophosphodiester phosphodiesterase [Burkholderiales bacterium]
MSASGDAQARVTFSDWPYPAFVAHRGAGSLAPENTLAALRTGRSFGYRMFEIDAKLSGDGVALLMHDATLDRTTDGRGRVDAQPFAALARLDAGSWHSAAFAGEGIPTLERVARWILANDAMLNIEIKPTRGRERETGAAVALDARAAWRDAGVPPLLSSFSPMALAAAREAAPELPRALLLDELPVDWLDRCTALGCVALDVEHSLLDAGLVARAHQASLRVLAWTVNDEARVEELFDAGLDAVITDVVDRIAPGRARRNPGTSGASC